jgi:hypothetical protein
MYYSPFQRDSIFGSRGTAFKHKWLRNGYAHPHNKENIQKAIHWACLAAKENQDTITFLTIPDEEWTTNDTPYKTIFEDTHVIIYFPLDAIIYTEPTIPLELNKEPRIETLAVRILCIHHKNTTIDIPNLKPNKISTTILLLYKWIIYPAQITGQWILGPNTSRIWHLEPTTSTKPPPKTNRTAKYTPCRNIGNSPHITNPYTRILQ